MRPRAEPLGEGPDQTVAPVLDEIRDASPS
jgi:hypothetical protein